jgi:hypothetical protein
VNNTLTVSLKLVRHLIPKPADPDLNLSLIAAEILIIFHFSILSQIITVNMSSTLLAFIPGKTIMPSA